MYNGYIKIKILFTKISTWSLIKKLLFFKKLKLRKNFKTRYLFQVYAACRNVSLISSAHSREARNWEREGIKCFVVRVNWYCRCRCVQLTCIETLKSHSPLAPFARSISQGLQRKEKYFYILIIIYVIIFI